MIQCNDVVKKYMSCTAVNHVSLSMDRGKIYTVLGPNGSGKTSLMKIIVGLILPNSGYVELDGVRVGTGTKADMVYMPTESYFYPYMKIKDIVKFEMDFYKDFSEERFYNLLENMHLEFSDTVKNMSTGMLAKLKLAVALARNAKLIMLDEPLNGIDILARETIIEAIKANIDGERTFLLSSHLVDELEPIVDGAFFMRNGELVLSGTKGEIVNEGKTLVDVYKEVYGYGGNAYGKAY